MSLTIYDLAEQTNLSEYTISNYVSAATHVDCPFNSLADAFRCFALQLEKSAVEFGPFIQTLQQLGIEAWESKDAMRTPDDILNDVANAISSHAISEERAEDILHTIFGNNGPELLPLLQFGADSIRRVGSEMSDTAIDVARGLSSRDGNDLIAEKALTIVAFAMSCMNLQLEARQILQDNAAPATQKALAQRVLDSWDTYAPPQDI